MLGVRGALMPWLSIWGECAPQGPFGNVFETFGVFTIGGLGTSESWRVETRHAAEHLANAQVSASTRNVGCALVGNPAF